MLGGANTRYEIVRKIARGGMGEVFLARQLGIGGFSKDVVLKQIHDTFADDPEFVTMFLEEARIAALLDHPNIVQIYGLGQQDRSHFIVMEYVPGLSVSRLVKRVDGPLPLHIGIQIAADVASGLQFAHDKVDDQGEPLGLVHRDVSPPNILVSTSGSVKITDFGIAKVKWSTTKTRAGVVKGKYSYLAPEQVKGDQADRQSDLYSLGLNLYEMTTGRRAYSKGDQIVVLRNVAKGKFPPPEEVVPDYPPDLRRVVMKALSLDRKKRYTQCSELQEDLLELLRVWGVNMTPTKLGQYVQEVITPGEAAAPVAEPIPPPVQEEQEEGTTPDLEPDLDPDLDPDQVPFGDQATQIVEMATVNLTASAVLPDVDTGAAVGIEGQDTLLQPPAMPPPAPMAVAGEVMTAFSGNTPTPPPVVVAGEVSVEYPAHIPTPAPGEVSVNFPVNQATPAGMAVGSGAVDYYGDAYEESDASPEAVKAAWAGVHATSETAAPRRLPRILLVGSAALAVTVIGVVAVLLLTQSAPPKSPSSGKVVEATSPEEDPDEPPEESKPPAEESTVARKKKASAGEGDEPAEEIVPDPSPLPTPEEVAAMSADAGSSPGSGDAQPGADEPSVKVEPLAKDEQRPPPGSPPAAVDTPPAPVPPVAPGTVPPPRKAAPRAPRITLSVSTDPPTKVYLGRRLLGKTPVTAKIPKRKATLVLRNRSLSLHTVRKINPQGSRVSTHFVLRKGRIGFAFKTPRQVRVDGKFVGTTPRPPLVLFEGYHQVLAVDRKHGWRFHRRVLVQPGKTMWVPRKK